MSSINMDLTDLGIIRLQEGFTPTRTPVHLKPVGVSGPTPSSDIRGLT